MPTKTVTIDQTLLQICFDVAVHSLDFSSGFLDDEEVSALREIAARLDVNPMVATPKKFKCKYYGHELWRDQVNYRHGERGMPSPTVCCNCNIDQQQLSL